MDPNPYDIPPPAPGADQLNFNPSNEERNFAIIAHLSGIFGIFAGGFLGFIGPLVIYLLKKESSPYVETQAKEALNFQITVFLIGLVCVALAGISCGTLLPLVFVPVGIQLIFGIIAALAVRDGSNYRYPFNFRLLQ
jgi:uncharacterized Tic20 family protein